MQSRAQPGCGPRILIIGSFSALAIIHPANREEAVEVLPLITLYQPGSILAGAAVVGTTIIRIRHQLAIFQTRANGQLARAIIWSAVSLARVEEAAGDAVLQDGGSLLEAQVESSAIRGIGDTQAIHLTQAPILRGEIPHLELAL